MSSSSSSSSLFIPSTNSKQTHSKLIQHTHKSHFFVYFTNYLKQTQPPKLISCHYTRNQEDHQVISNKSSSGLQFIRHKKLLSELSTWGIGGPCNYFIQVTTYTQLLSVVRFCNDHSIRFLVVGKGSNCLFDDNGFDGCVILNRIEFVEKIEAGVYRVGSGYPFNRLGIQCCNDGFSGLEFAAGVPGSVGGAVYMNAGANGQETAGAIDSVEIITIDGRYQTLYRTDLVFGYRTSSFQYMEDLAAIVAVTFGLTPLASAKKRQQAFLARRKSSQPVGERSAGSVFQNPSGYSAGELIEKAGLKGYRLGGAKVSDIHANFIINYDGSTSRDVLELIDLVKAEVYLKFGIKLKEEVKYIKACNGTCSNIESIL